MLPYQDVADKARDQSLGRWNLGLPGASSTDRNKRSCHLVNRDLVEKGCHWLRELSFRVGPGHPY